MKESPKLKGTPEVNGSMKENLDVQPITLNAEKNIEKPEAMNIENPKTTVEVTTMRPVINPPAEITTRGPEVKTELPKIDTPTMQYN